MATDTRCIHDMLDGQCAICLKHDMSIGSGQGLLESWERTLQREQRQQARQGSTIAQYPGDCGKCGQPFKEGAVIWFSHLAQRWAGPCCSPEVGC